MITFNESPPNIEKKTIVDHEFFLFSGFDNLYIRMDWFTNTNIPRFGWFKYSTSIIQICIYKYIIHLHITTHIYYTFIT